jgi:outer membrane protein
MKKFLFLLLTVCTAATAAHAAGGKTAFVDTQTVFDKTTLGKKYQGILREYFDSRKKILDLDANEIQSLRDDYAKQSAVLKPEARKEKEEQITKKLTEFEKKRDSFNEELSRKNEELSKEFNDRMSVVLKAMAKKEKVDLILNKSISLMNKGEVPAVLYGNEDLDLTDRVIAEMDKHTDAEK